MQSRFIFQKIGVACWLLALSVGCSRTDTDSGVAPDEACRVQTETSTLSGSGFNVKTLTTYSYDAAKQLTSQLESYTQSSGNGTIRLDYKYNAEGLVTQRTRTASENSGSTFIRTNSYQYENGRLVRDVHVDGSTTSTFSYSYDAGGRLVRYGIGGNTYSFTNGVLTDVDDKGAKAPVIADGRIVRLFVFNDGKQDFFIHYSYNAAGQLQKDYLGDAKGVDLNGYVNQYEYTSQPLKEPTPPALKGHPLIELFGKPGYRSRQIATAPKANKARDYTIDIQYKTNNKGYLTERISTTTGYEPRLSKIEYTYSNCQ